MCITCAECVFVALAITACTVLAPYFIVYALSGCRLRLKCDGTRAETRFRLSAKRKSPFKSAGGGGGGCGLERAAIVLSLASKLITA